MEPGRATLAIRVAFNREWTSSTSTPAGGPAAASWLSTASLSEGL
jgi:hypothetical protein